MENENILNSLLDKAIDILIILENKRKLDESYSELKAKLDSFNKEGYQICSEGIIDGAFNELKEFLGYQFVIKIRSFYEIFCDILKDEKISDENKDKLKEFLNEEQKCLKEKPKFFSQFISETKDIKYSTLSWIIHDFEFSNYKYSSEEMKEKINKSFNEAIKNTDFDSLNNEINLLNKILREIDNNVEDWICVSSNRSIQKPWIISMLENLVNKLFSLKTNKIIRDDFDRRFKL